MPINGYDRTGQATADDLDVPDFLKPDWVPGKTPRTIPGEVIPQPAEPDEDDIAPGVIEYRPVRTPVLYRTGSAAMVVASRTGRVVGLSARHGWTAGGWFGHGLRSATVLGYRYVRGHDHIEVIGGMTSGADWSKIERTRKARWRTLGWLTGGTVVADLAAWWALVNYGGMSALDWSWAVAPSTEALAAGLALTVYGKYRLEAGLAPGQIVDPADVDDGEEPYPLAWCKGSADVVECVGRALAHEGIGTRRIDLLAAREWGWEVDIDLKGSTPGDVNKVADQMDAHFNIKQGGTLIEPDVKNSAHIALRLITGDPFANMPKAQVHAPNSLDITEPVNMFYGMDGSRPEIVLEGTRILTIGVSGSAKSTGVLRDIAEVVTACHNAIALDLDPVKDGLREFEGVMAVPPIRGNKPCEEWLDYLVRMAEARNAVRNRLDMGDNWVATAEHPAIFPMVDEFIYLSPKAKESFIKLLRLGKQVGMYPSAAGQDATSGSLGDAIADSFTLRVMLASRHADIPLVFGTGAIAAGWRPDRLQPAQNQYIRNDAGQSYIKGAGLDRPILYGWNELSRDQVQRAVKDRQAAGRPWFDYDTLAEAKLLHVITRDGAAGGISLADRLDALAEQGGIEDARVVAVLLREFELSGEAFLPTSEVLLPALHNSGFEGLDPDKLGRLLRKHAVGVKATRGDWEGVDGKPRGWDRSAIEQAAAALMDPARTRKQGG